MSETDEFIIEQEIILDEKQVISQELFTKATRSGMIEYIERDVEKFDFEGFEVVRRELFSKANCPAVTLKYGSVLFNIRAVRKLDECMFVQILINKDVKRMIVNPCSEDAKGAIQWSRIDKRGKVVSREIRAKPFTAQLYEDMNWSFSGTIKMLGTLLKCGGEKIFVFDLNNAEKYLRIAAPTAENPNRYERVPLMPSHWENRYGESYEDSIEPLVKTFEDVPDGFVKVILPPVPSKRPKSEVDNIGLDAGASINDIEQAKDDILTENIEEVAVDESN